MATLTFIGTGEALEPELGNTSLLYRGSRTLLLDCGYAAPRALWRVLTDPSLLDGVYLSHLHADHAFGLPALLLWMRLEGRARPLDLLGTPSTLAGARRILELGYPGSFTPDKCFEIRDHPLDPDGAPVPWGELSFRVAATHHKRAHNHAVRLSDGERPRFVYSGDGRPSRASEALCEGVPLVVHECFGLDPASTPEGHADLESLLRMAEARAVPRLYLLHFNRQRRTEIEAAIASRAQSFRAGGEGRELAAPRAGLTVTVD